MKSIMRAHHPRRLGLVYCVGGGRETSAKFNWRSPHPPQMRIPGRGRLNRFQTAVPKKKRKKICQFFLAHTPCQRIRIPLDISSHEIPIYARGPGMTGAVISWTRRFIHVYVCASLYRHYTRRQVADVYKVGKSRVREITKGKSQSFFSPAFRVRIYITYNGAHHTNYPGDYSARFHVDGRSAPVLLSFLFSLSLSPACSRQKREEESYQNSVDKNSDNNAIEREREMYTVRVKFDC
jgi:hypothetical protein